MSKQIPYLVTNSFPVLSAAAIAVGKRYELDERFYRRLNMVNEFDPYSTLVFILKDSLDISRDEAIKLLNDEITRKTGKNRSGLIDI
jgi:hypothetical protein